MPSDAEIRAVLLPACRAVLSDLVEEERHWHALIESEELDSAARQLCDELAPAWARMLRERNSVNSSSPLALTQARAASLIRQTVRQCDHVSANDKLGWGDVCEFCARVTAGILGYHDVETK